MMEEGRKQLAQLTDAECMEESSDLHLTEVLPTHRCYSGDTTKTVECSPG
jgi:hypothetical protein